jgi:hypothetical protein
MTTQTPFAFSGLVPGTWGVSTFGFDSVAFESGRFAELCPALGPAACLHHGRNADDSLSAASH